ncbi:MAG: YggT family protein [Actinomycetaceae bacterium]|nr:YggT family protein [Actinomycetaceae bacterium]MDY6083042.1 YggT family protein [Actinomycetaceae bacterium]
MYILFSILLWLLQLYVLVLFARVILDLVGVVSRSWTPQGIVLVIANVVYGLTDPPLRFLGRYIKPLRIGNVALDVGFIVLFVAVEFLRYLIQLAIVYSL